MAGKNFVCPVILSILPVKCPVKVTSVSQPWLVTLDIFNFLPLAERYRLQCDLFEGMWLTLHELISRLQSYHTSRKMSDFRISYDGQLPLQEYFDVLDRHFEVCRKNTYLISISILWSISFDSG